MNTQHKLKTLLMYVVFGLVVSFAILLFIDQVYLAQSNEPNKKAVVPATIEDIPKDAESIGFSSDNRSYMYIRDGELYIKYIQDGSMQKAIVDKNPIVAAVPMDDRNIVLYFTVDRDVSYTQQVTEEAAKPQYDPESGAPLPTPGPTVKNVTRTVDVVEIMTYNMDTGESTSQQKIKVSKFDSIEQMDYSSMTNVIYLKIAAKGTAGIKDSIYRINIMKTVSLYASASDIGKMALLSAEDSLYYQRGNTVYFNKRALSGLKDAKPLLLACSKDMAYIASESNPDTIYKYKGAKPAGEIATDGGAIKSAYANRGKVYLIYDEYMLEITGASPKKTNFKNGAEFLAVSNGVLYTRTDDGVVKSQRIK